MLVNPFAKKIAKTMAKGCKTRKKKEKKK